MSLLGGRAVKYYTRRVFRDGAIDAAISKGAGRPWQNYTLGQSQNVSEWITDPGLVDTRIIPNLERFAALLKPGARVLDVGCYGGYGFDWLAMRVPDLHYVGVDIEPRAVREAKKAHTGTEAVFDTGDIYDLAPTIAKHGPFDAVLCLRVVIHVPWLEKCLEQLSAAAPLALVGLRVGENDIARQRVDEVSGETHFFRVYSWPTVVACLPKGKRHAYYPDQPYQSLVMFTP